MIELLQENQAIPISKTFLTPRGYGLLKSSFPADVIERVKDELTVSPSNLMLINALPPKFQCYLESNKKLYIPKVYGLKKFGIPDENKLSKGDDINLTFNGTLRDNQIEPVKKLLEACNDPKRMGGLLNLKCGFGKCLGFDTPIIMYDGSIKKVQNIVVDDFIMGDDSTPRKVLSLARGKEMMYQISSPYENDDYIVNESHILSLKCNSNYGNKFIKNNIYDISVRDYLKLPKSFFGNASKLVGYKVPVNFDSVILDFEPYLMGYLLSSNVMPDFCLKIRNKTILNYITTALQSYDLYLKHYSDDIFNILPSNTINNLIKLLRHYGVCNNIHIPQDYKCNSKENRQKLLAGIIDAKGFFDKRSNHYKISVNNSMLANDILFVARSLGYKSRVKMFESSDKTNKYNIIIVGSYLSEIPAISSQNICFKNTTRSNLHYRIKITKLKVDNYYGFEIDGNKRFVLQNFAVTHNTSIALYAITQLKKKTMILLHKNFLIEQWKERIQQFLPECRIGIIKAQIIDIEDKDIVLVSLQSLSMKDYEPSLFNSFGTIVVDEIHRSGSEVYSRAYFKYIPTYSIGLSATMTRKDGLTKVFKNSIGDIVYKNIKHSDTLHVLCKNFKDIDNDAEKYSKELRMFNGSLQVPSMITNISLYEPRTNFIIDTLKDVLIKEPNRCILILSDRRKHLEHLKRKIEFWDLGTAGYYIGGMKDFELKKTEDTCTIVLATYSLAAEGLDLPKLDTLFLATPKCDIQQSIGRILRKKPEDRQYVPLVVDFIDDFSIFPKQFKKRQTYYKKNKYTIIRDDEDVDSENEDENKKNIVDQFDKFVISNNNQID